MKRLAFVGILGLLVLGLGMPPAHAIPTLKLTDGIFTVTIADGGSGDLNPAVGAVTFLGAVGNWNLNVTTGLTDPVLGSLLQPYMDLNSVNVATAGGAPPLTIYWSDTGFGPITNTAFNSSIGGTTGTTVEFSSYLNTDNELFGTGTLLSSLGAFGSGAFSGSAVSSLQTAGSPFSLTEMVVIEGSLGATTTSFDAELRAVPEPSTLFLLGTGLAMLGLALRRRLPE